MHSSASNYGETSNADFLRSAYQGVLGRPVDDSGLNYYTPRLDSGKISRDHMLGVLRSVGEYQDYLTRLRGQVTALGAEPGFQNGGMIPGAANNNGGVVGNGRWGIDSVMAQYAGGGYIPLAGGEGILTAQATAAIGGASVIDWINRHHSMPEWSGGYEMGGVVGNDRYAPTISEFRPVRNQGDDGQSYREVVAELRAVKEELKQLRKERLTATQMQTRELARRLDENTSETAGVKEAVKQQPKKAAVG